MRAHTKAVLLAVLLASNPRAFALSSSLDISQYAHTAWRSGEGFPVRGVIAGIAQTPDGYLWIATEFGTLLRFDGVRTVPLNLSIHEHIVSMFASRDGTLWIGSEGGLASWRAGTLTKYSELEGTYANSFAEDGDGTIWVGLSWDPGGGRVCAIRRGTAQCSPPHGSLGRYVRSMCRDGDKLWVYAETGLWQWKPAPARLPTVQKPVGWHLSRMSCTNDVGGSLIAIPGGVSQVVGGEMLPFRLPDSPNVPDPTSMLRDRDGGLWIGTASHGLLHVHEGRTDRFMRSDGLSGDLIRMLFEDREGNIWVATLDGLDRFRERAVPTVSVGQGLSRSDVWSVLGARDGSVWIGSRDGLQRWKDGRFTSYPPGGGLGDNPGSLFEDERGRIWTSTSRGLACFSEGRFTPVTREPTGQVHSITEDRGGRLWFSEDFEGRQSIGSLEVGTVDGGEVHRIPRDRLGLKESTITLSRDALRGGLWIGARNALAYFKDGTLQESFTTADGRPFEDVSGIYSDAEGTLWAAADAGLLRLRDGRLTILTTANGLPCAPPVWWVTEDDDRSLWLSLNCGVARIRRPELEAWAADTKRTVAVTIFDNADGVRQRWNPSQGYGPFATRSKDGKVWFIGMDGVGVIDPRRLSHNQLPPPVHIERIAANGKLYWQNLTAIAPSSLALPPVIRDLEIEFTALSLAVPDKVRFRYKLEGQDPDWKEVANERKVQYSNLAPGSYRFRVTASNNSGVWNDAGDALGFVVAPAYYQTTWFRALCAVAVVALLGALYLLRVRRLQGQEKQLRGVIEGMPAMAFSVHPDGSPDFVNKRWRDYAGRSNEPATRGGDWQATIHPDDVEIHFRKWQEALSGGGPFENEARHRSASGKYRWFLVRAVPFRDKQGKIVNWYGTLTDIEDRKRAEEERETLQTDLAHLNRVSMMGELTASLTHEIRQPITAAVTNASACLRWLGHDRPRIDKAREAANNIVEDGMRAGEIIDRLRSLYKKSPPKRESVEVSEIIDEMVMLLRSEANRYAVSMRTDIAAGLPRITADRVQLQQVLMNLMLNGIEAMRDSAGELTIASHLGQDGELRISVRDSGVGLPAGRVDQIFNAFFTTKPQGSGMGLAISRSIVESHGGRLWATANEGTGATFHISLPIAPQVEEVPATGA